MHVSYVPGISVLQLKQAMKKRSGTRGTHRLTIQKGQRKPWGHGLFGCARRSPTGRWVAQHVASRRAAFARADGRGLRLRLLGTGHREVVEDEALDGQWELDLRQAE